MSALGLVMFAVAMVLIIATGLPVYAALLGVSSVFAALGVALGAFDWPLLSALPYRVVGLLEHDLLQALPLYAFIGALLNRLPLAELLYRTGERLCSRSPAAAEMSALCVGALLAPMNGSVGASLHTLSRKIAPALTEHGTSPARAAAIVCVASTLGVVIPPSLVLLLLGDAMMRAHTEAVNVTHAAVRIVNTQDVMRAAIVPGALVLLLALLTAAYRARGATTSVRSSMPRGPMITAALAALVIGCLMVGVAMGRLYAVEAAATGCLLLVIYAACSGQVDRALVRHVLHDTMTLTGLLLGLLVSATTFSLVLRGYGTDVLIAQTLGSMTGSSTWLMLAVLGGLVACSFVLDAFEMIFLVIPLVMPPLLMAVPDPAWVAAVTLLVLQAGFLLPPFGYAVLMSRTLMPGSTDLGSLGRALLPQLAGQAVLIAVVLSFPQITRWTRPAESVPDTALSAEVKQVQRFNRADGADADQRRSHRDADCRIRSASPFWVRA